MFIHYFLLRKVFLRSCLMTLSFLLITNANAQTHTQFLSLDTAAKMTLQRHPQLHVFKWRQQALDGQRLSADQAAAYELAVEAENILGTGDYSGLSAIEMTLALSSLIELGDKRSARTNVVDTSYAYVEAQRKAVSLDLLGEMTQVFITTLALQQKHQLAQDATDLAHTTYQQIQKRVNLGAAAKVDVLLGKANMLSAQLITDELSARLNSQKMLLASYMGQQQPSFEQVSGNLFAFNSVESFDTLYQRVEASPAIEMYASQERIREADWQLAKSQSTADIRWQVGVKHTQSNGDNALMVGFSMPLFASERNRGNVQTAIAAKNEVSVEKAASLVALRTRLFQAYSSREQQVNAVESLKQNIIPLLTESLTYIQQSYQKGRYDYADLVLAQQALLDARLSLIDAATSVLLNQAMIEQLTAQSFATH